MKERKNNTKKEETKYIIILNQYKMINFDYITKEMKEERNPN